MAPVAPLLSILIPTKDRYDTLTSVVQQIASHIADPRLEIIICDNSDEQLSNIEQIFVSDPRISYYYFNEHVSIIENTERAIALSTGKYLCFIGDDDFVSPDIMSAVSWLASADEECLIYPPARYWWNGVEFENPTRKLHAGAFWLPKSRRLVISRLESKVELKRVLDRGGTSYADLPRLYHGIVARTAIQRIKDVFGSTVPGSSPDMALSVALALTNEQYLSIDYPLTVFGASSNSGGGRTAARRHYGRISDQRHLPQNILENWDEYLPKIWSEQIIYPQTIHEVMKKSGDARRISYPMLYGSLAAYEPYILRLLLPIMIKRVKSHPKEWLEIAAAVFLKIAGRIRTSIRNQTGFGLAYDVEDLANEGAVMPRLKEFHPNLGTLLTSASSSSRMSSNYD